MSCKGQLEPPKPKLPAGLKVPFGDSIDKVKSFATGGGLDNALKSVGGMIDGFIDGAIGSITSAIDGAVNGITSLKDKIKNFDPSAQFKSFGGVDDIKSKIKGQIPGKDEMKQLENAQLNSDCAKEQLSKLAEQKAKIAKKAADKAKQLSNKQKLEAAKSPEKKAEISAELAKEAEQELAAEIEEQANNDVETRTAAETLQDSSLNSLKGGVSVEVPQYVDSIITTTKVGWTLSNIQNETGDFDVTGEYINNLFKPQVQSFVNGVGSNKEEDLLWKDQTQPDVSKHMVIDDRRGSINQDYGLYSWRSPDLFSDTSPGYWYQTMIKSVGVPVDPDNALYSMFIQSFTKKFNDKYIVNLIINLGFTHSQEGNDFYKFRRLAYRDTQVITTPGEELTLSVYKTGLKAIYDRASKIDPLDNNLSPLSTMVTKY